MQSLKHILHKLNPHFLHNTFSTIIWLIEEERYESAIYAIQQLSVLLRNTMGKGGRVVSISEEVEHLRSYIDIQQLRYCGRFKSMIFIDNCVMQYCITRVVLQPLVENAIYHGTKYLEHGGIIKVIGRKIDDNVVIKVYDNGPSNEDDIAKINKELHELHDKGKVGIGIKNVHLRLQSQFGSQYGLHYEKEDNFTVAVIVIPAIEWED